MALQTGLGPSSSSSSSTHRTTLDDLWLFLSHVASGWHTFYSADIGVWKVASTMKRRFSVTMKWRYVSTSSESCRQKEETSHTFTSNLDFLEVIGTMVACSTWTRGDFVFYNESDFVPELDDLVVKLFSLLGSSLSLTTVHVLFYRFYHKHLPKLLGELRFLESLTLDARPMSLPEHVHSIAEYLEQNATLKLCTLVLNSCKFGRGSHSTLGTILKPFTDGAILKELVLKFTPSKETDFGESSIYEKLVCANCYKAIADMVPTNRSLVKLELRCSHSRDSGCALVGSALEANDTLQEFGFPCSVAGLTELVRSLSGPQANSSLSTLKLFPSIDCWRVDFMTELARLLMSNNTLKAVYISKQKDGNSWPLWNTPNLTAANYVEHMTWRKLELMMNRELKVNSSLNCLVVGNWMLRRVDTE